MASKVYYVSLFKRWNMRSGTYSLQIGASDTRPNWKYGDTTAIFEVRLVKSKPEAIAAVMQWLYDNRNGMMAVQEITDELPLAF